MYILKKRARKLENILLLLFPLMTTLYNFPLKIETSQAKRVVERILETKYVTGIVHIWFIHFSIKKLKTKLQQKPK